MAPSSRKASRRGDRRTITVLQHVPFEGPAAIAEWAEARGHRIEIRRVYEGVPLPRPGETDALVVMGGPMSVNDAASHPWLDAESRLLAAWLDAECPLLGICLGAQLLARAAGARVTPASQREIGWLPVERLAAAERSLLAPLPAHCVPLHWHGETFELPKGALPLARSERCANQAFQLGRAALGLQFHLEATPKSTAALLEACGDEVATPGDGVQPADQIRDEAAKRCAALRAPLEAILDAWISASPRR